MNLLGNIKVIYNDGRNLIEEKFNTDNEVKDFIRRFGLENNPNVTIQKCYK